MLAEPLAMIALRQAAGTGLAVVGFDIVAFSALAVVVVHFGTRQLRVEGRNFRHNVLHGFNVSSNNATGTKLERIPESIVESSGFITLCVTRVTPSRPTPHFSRTDAVFSNAWNLFSEVIFVRISAVHVARGRRTNSCREFLTCTSCQVRV